jgi:hypothetical protein
MSTNQTPLSAEKKYLQKVEKELKQLKSSSGILKVSDTKMFEIATNKDLGDHLLVNFGASGGASQASVIHKPIGKDPSIPDGSWVMSQTRDIPHFFKTKDHPGYKKLDENITNYRDEIIVELGFLTKKSDSKFYYTMDDHVPQNTHISDAKWFRTEYAKVKGIQVKDAPTHIYFMEKSNAKKEMNFQLGLIKSEQFKKKMLPELKKLYSHQPHLLTMQTQVAVPWLHGAQAEQLAQLLYLRMLGQNTNKFIQDNDVPDDYDVLKYTYAVLDEEDFPDPEQMGYLKEALKIFADANKAKNIAIAESKAKANSGTKEEKKILVNSISEANEKLNQSKAAVNRVGIDFPADAYKTVEHSILKKSDYTGSSEDSKFKSSKGKEVKQVSNGLSAISASPLAIPAMGKPAGK